MSQLALDTFRSQGATFSPDRRYRYTLWRIWGDAGRLVLFLMLNPSTADETALDPTLVKCMKFARRWGYDGFYVANLFALRSTDPEALLEADEPVGWQNDACIAASAMRCERVVCAWGSHRAVGSRARALMTWLAPLAEMLCLHRNADGHPQHPLYVSGDVEPVDFTYEAA